MEKVDTITNDDLKKFRLKFSRCAKRDVTRLFERLFKIKKNGIFLFEISFFFLEIFTFLYYANEESDDVISSST